MKSKMLWLSVLATGSLACLPTAAEEKPAELVRDLVFEFSRFSEPIVLDLPNNEARRHELFKKRYAGKRVGLAPVGMTRAKRNTSESLLEFLLNRGYVEIVSETLKTKTGARRYDFVVHTEKLRRHVPDPSTADELAVGERRLLSIDYSNKYIATPALRGVELTFVALTFSYAIDTMVDGFPEIGRTFQGKAKAYLEPDDGQWKLVNITLPDDGSYEYTREFQKLKELAQRPSEFVAAAGEGDVDRVRTLVSKVDVNARDDEHSTALHRAAMSGHRDVVALLIEAGAQVDARDGTDRTPLRWAAGRDHPAVAQALIAGGADLEAKASGQTPLLVAATNGHARVVEVLVDAGANLEAQDDGWTPLLAAAVKGHAGAVQVLANAGADLEAIRNGWTPLVAATRRSHDEVVEALLEAGANPEFKREKWSPLMLTAYEGDIKIAIALLRAGADSSAEQAIAQAEKQGRETIAEMLKDAQESKSSNEDIGVFLSRAGYWIRLADARQSKDNGDLDKALAAVTEALNVSDGEEASKLREKIWKAMGSEAYFGSRYRQQIAANVADEDIQFLAVAPRNNAVFAGTERSVYRLDLSSEPTRSNRLVDVDEDIDRFGVNDKRALIALGVDARNDPAPVQLRNAESGELISTVGVEGGLEHLVVGSEGKALITLNRDRELRSWNIDDPEKPTETWRGEGGEYFQYSPNWTYIAIARRGGHASEFIDISEYDSEAEAYQPKHRLDFGNGDLWRLQFSRDSSQIAVYSSHWSMQQNVHIYDLESGSLTKTFKEPWDYTALNGDFSVLATADGRSGSIELVGVSDENTIRELDISSDVTTLQFDKTRLNYLVSGHEDGHVAVWGVDAKQVRNSSLGESARVAKDR